MNREPVQVLAEWAPSKVEYRWLQTALQSGGFTTCAEELRTVTRRAQGTLNGALQSHSFSLVLHPGKNALQSVSPESQITLRTPCSGDDLQTLLHDAVSAAVSLALTVSLIRKLSADVATRTAAQ